MKNNGNPEKFKKLQWLKLFCILVLHISVSLQLINEKNFSQKKVDNTKSVTRFGISIFTQAGTLSYVTPCKCFLTLHWKYIYSNIRFAQTM